MFGTAMHASLDSYHVDGVIAFQLCPPDETGDHQEE
jgi:hypothetical protein